MSIPSLRDAGAGAAAGGVATGSGTEACCKSVGFISYIFVLKTAHFNKLRQQINNLQLTQSHLRAN